MDLLQSSRRLYFWRVWEPSSIMLQCKLMQAFSSSRQKPGDSNSTMAVTLYQMFSFELQWKLFIMNENIDFGWPEEHNVCMYKLIDSQVYEMIKGWMDNETTTTTTTTITTTSKGRQGCDIHYTINHWRCEVNLSSRTSTQYYFM